MKFADPCIEGRGISGIKILKHLCSSTGAEYGPEKGCK
jgi:hypothetical protein